MACTEPYKKFKGDTAVLLLKFTRTSDGEPMNLDTDVTDIQLQVKAADNDPDPALIDVSLLGGGIVKLTQSGDTLGHAHATIDATADAAMAPAVYRYDVVAILTSGARHHGVYPSDFIIAAVVNG